ncbi:hypothetical protein F511_26603 [Dorcoceras hygrometricum]|uniref:Uncharacterized protein n=1 Tax=Dorcoceras hygrometricum TaxID=472368 RepID=A0A2Z7DKE6_9LAMI|nr:hypothetical protein F511_26603 [Dorcoceras hygrometricum]
MIPLGITDSACKNQLVVVSVQYGPFNTYIPIRSTTIGKSRVARDPIAMHTYWISNSDIASVTSIGYPRMRASGESSTMKHRLLHASGSHPIPPPNDPNEGTSELVQQKSSRLQITPSWSTSLIHEQFRDQEQRDELKYRTTQEQIKCSVQVRRWDIITGAGLQFYVDNWLNQPVKERSGKRKPDQGSQQLDAHDGEAEGCCRGRSNQLKGNHLRNQLKEVTC